MPWLSRRQWNLVLASIEDNSNFRSVILQKVNHLMSVSDDLKAALADLSTAVDGVKTTLDGLVANQATIITDLEALEANVGNNNGVTAADAAQFVSTIADIKSRLAGVQNEASTAASSLAAALPAAPAPTTTEPPASGS